jgi:hypothetical protein
MPEDLNEWLTKGRKALDLARKGVNQWLDAPEGRVPKGLFVVGCQRSGTTMLIDTLMKAPQLWSHPEKSNIAYDNYRLRTPSVVDLVIRSTPADTVVFKPLCDSHLADKILDAHADSRAIWMVRSWPDVASSAVKKWGSHQADVVRAIADGRADEVGWRGERIPAQLIAQLREVVTPEMSDIAGAALFWYVRNSFYFMLGLDQDPRVRLVRYEHLVTRPGEVFPALFAHIGASYDPAWIEDIQDRSTPTARPDGVSDDIAALCDALQARLKMTN